MIYVTHLPLFIGCMHNKLVAEAWPTPSANVHVNPLMLVPRSISLPHGAYEIYIFSPARAPRFVFKCNCAQLISVLVSRFLRECSICAQHSLKHVCSCSMQDFLYANPYSLSARTFCSPFLIQVATLGGTLEKRALVVANGATLPTGWSSIGCYL
jgi:hypothetical protein